MRRRSKYLPVGGTLLPPISVQEVNLNRSNHFRPTLKSHWNIPRPGSILPHRRLRLFAVKIDCKSMKLKLWSRLWSGSQVHLSWPTLIYKVFHWYPIFFFKSHFPRILCNTSVFNPRILQNVEFVKIDISDDCQWGRFNRLQSRLHSSNRWQNKSFWGPVIQSDTPFFCSIQHLCGWSSG